MKKRSFQYTCKFCDKTVLLKPKMIVQHVVRDERGNIELTGTFFECPVCGNLELKYVDNDSSLSIKSALMYYEEKLLKSQSHGKMAHKKQVEKRNALAKELNRVRDILTRENRERFISFIEKTEIE